MKKHSHDELMTNWKIAVYESEAGDATRLEEASNQLQTLPEKVQELVWLAPGKTHRKRVFHQMDVTTKELHAEAAEAIDCTKCGHCCTEFNCGTPEGSELTAIAEYLNEPPEEVASKWKTGSKGRCPMLGEDGRCTVYEVRPDTCRGWPHIQKDNYLDRATGVCSRRCGDCPMIYHLANNIQDRLEINVKDSMKESQKSLQQVEKSKQKSEKKKKKAAAKAKRRSKKRNKRAA